MGWCKAVWKLGGWKPWEIGFVGSIANLCTLPITFTILEPKFCSIGCHMIQMVLFLLRPFSLTHLQVAKCFSHTVAAMEVSTLLFATGLVQLRIRLQRSDARLGSLASQKKH